MWYLTRGATDCLQLEDNSEVPCSSGILRQKQTQSRRCSRVSLMYIGHLSSSLSSVRVRMRSTHRPTMLYETVH